MMQPSKDIERRRPVWSALSDLFLDTELDESALRYIGQKLVDSGYTDDELATILYGEVFPVCIWNLRSVAGEWAEIDADWLQTRILGNEGKFWKKWRCLQFGHRMIRDDWNTVMAIVHEQAGRRRR
ncbi:MAG TPA: hypothetical protein VG269_20635 [Tepidisphaeraceae bacterium]|jgi:hypothetical protein|nr:hypothetical protein [Tepidisphaeraceae bacterium]